MANMSAYELADYMKSRGHKESQSPLDDAQAGDTVVVLTRRMTDAKFYQRQVYVWALREKIEIKQAYNLRFKFVSGGSIIIVPATAGREGILSYLSNDSVKYSVQG